MSVFSFETTRSGHSVSTLLSRLLQLADRASAFWRRRRVERMLESLSYDTLKDIGFPSADDARNVGRT